MDWYEVFRLDQSLDDFQLFLYGLANQSGTLVSAELFAALSQFVSAEGVDVELSLIPEPTSIALLFFGSVTLAGRSRRRVSKFLTS